MTLFSDLDSSLLISTGYKGEMLTNIWESVLKVTETTLRFGIFVKIKSDYKCLIFSSGFDTIFSYKSLIV